MIIRKFLLALLLFCFLPSAFALSIQRSIEVTNALVPANSQWASQIQATVAFSSDREPITSGQSIALNIQPSDIGVIVVSAPFCNSSYLGFTCNAAIPRACIEKIYKNGRMLISGVLSEYGLDLMSLRCFYVEIDE